MCLVIKQLTYRCRWYLEQLTYRANNVKMELEQMAIEHMEKEQMS